MEGVGFGVWRCEGLGLWSRRRAGGTAVGVQGVSWPFICGFHGVECIGMVTLVLGLEENGRFGQSGR